MPQSIEVLPPGQYQVTAGRSATKELTLTVDSVRITVQQPGRPTTKVIKYWEPQVPTFMGQFLADN
jgi:hypothetical protein